MIFFGLNIEETLDFFQSRLYQSSLPNYVIFFIFVLLAIGIGQIVPSLLKLIFYLFDRQQKKNLYNLFVKPIRGSIEFCSAIILIYWVAEIWLKEYQALAKLIEPLIKLGFLTAIAWIISRILRQFIRVYGIKLLRQSGLVVNEMLLVKIHYISCLMPY